MPHSLARAVYASPTRCVARSIHTVVTREMILDKLADSHIVRWRRYQWPINGIAPKDPETIVSSMRDTRRLTPEEVADRRNRVQERACKHAQDIENFSVKYRHFDARNFEHIRILSRWEAAGPPPLSEYRLTFGKHRGKRLEEVPDTYLVKYLVPRSMQFWHECPLVADAIGDFQKRHPHIKSQAGRKATKNVPKRGIPRKSEIQEG